MVSKIEERLDDVEIVDELHYSFVHPLNGTITYNSDIRSVESDASRHTMVQDEKKKENRRSTTKQKKKDLSKIRCYNCQKFGHLAYQCTQEKRKRKKYESTKSVDEPLLKKEKEDKLEEIVDDI